MSDKHVQRAKILEKVRGLLTMTVQHGSTEAEAITAAADVLRVLALNRCGQRSAARAAMRWSRFYRRVSSVCPGTMPAPRVSVEQPTMFKKPLRIVGLAARTACIRHIFSLWRDRELSDHLGYRYASRPVLPGFPRASLRRHH